MKKEDYIVLALIGILIVIIALPTKSQNSDEKVSSVEEQKKLVSSETERTLGNSLKTDDNMCYGNEMGISRYNSYVENMETQVEHILENVSGAGNVEVMITLFNMGENIVEKDTDTVQIQTEESDSVGGSRKQQENSRVYETIYTVDDNGNNIPYVVQTLLPKVEGVVVLAEGADMPTVKQNIIGAIQVLFNLSEHKIKVIKMKS